MPEAQCMAYGKGTETKKYGVCVIEIRMTLWKKLLKSLTANTQMWLAQRPQMNIKLIFDKEVVRWLMKQLAFYLKSKVAVT